MSILYNLSIHDTITILKNLNNSDETMKYFKYVYNEFYLKIDKTLLHEIITQMYKANLVTIRALTQAENTINQAIENMKIVKPLKILEYQDFDKLWINTINSLIIAVRKALCFEIVSKTFLLVTQSVIKMVSSQEDTDNKVTKNKSLMDKILYKNEELATIMFSLAQLMRKANTLRALGALAEYTLKKSLIIRNMQKLHDTLFMIVNIVTLSSAITMEITKQLRMSSLIKMARKLDEVAITTNNAIINAMVIKKINVTINNEDRQQDISEAAMALLIIAEIPNKEKLSHKPNRIKIENMNVKIIATAAAIKESVNSIKTIYSVVILVQKEVQKVKSQYELRNMTDI